MELNPTQASTIKTLRRDVGNEDLSASPAATIAAMDKRYVLSSTRVVLAALKKVYPDCKEFAAESAKRRVEFKKIDESQTPTAKQAEKYVAWPDVLAFRDQHREDMTDTEYLLLCLYTMWPPVRADYTPMEIVTRKPRKLTDGTNYVIVSKGSISVLFHAYKTHAVYGDLLRKMPKPLERVTREYLAARPDQKYLFEDGGVPWQAQRLGVTIRRIFQRFHGLDTGISTLRHSFATHSYRGMPAMTELKKLSQSLMHSMSTSQAYRHIDLE